MEEKAVMTAFDKEDAAGMKHVESEISRADARIAELDAQEVELSIGIRQEKEKFDGLKKQAADLDQDELNDARLVLRPQMEREAQARIRKEEGGREINFWHFQSSSGDVDKLLDEDNMAERREAQKRRMEREKTYQSQKRKPRSHEQER